MHALIDDLNAAARLVDAGRLDDATAVFSDVERRLRSARSLDAATLRELTDIYAACLDRLVARREALAAERKRTRLGWDAARHYLDGVRT